MIFDSTRQGGNARLQRGALERAGIRVNGSVLAGLKGAADVQERAALETLILRRRMEAQDLLRRREMEKRR